MFYLDDATITWVTIMWLLFLLALGFVLFGKKYKSRIIGSFPTIASTIGVFGTFWGITSGLMGFNPNDLDGSIPILLSGLKTAFITSLLGMLFSLILRWILDHRLDKDQTYIPTPTDVAISDMLVELKMQTGYAQRNHKMLSEHQNDVQDVFSQLEKVLEKLNSFEQTIAKSNSEVLAKAMENATAEFSQKINDVVERLVKENFDQLNHSVENLNTWQKENKEAMEMLADDYKQVATYIKEMYAESGVLDKLIGNVKEHAGQLDKYNIQLGNIIPSMNNTCEQLNRLNHWLTSCMPVDFREKMKDEIERELNERLVELEKCVIKTVNILQDPTIIQNLTAQLNRIESKL